MKKLIMLALLLLNFVPPAYAQEKESAYDRVMRTGTIRCGYGIWDIYLSKDPNTGKMGGIFHDLMESLGAALKLKVEWTEEVGWGDYIAGLEANRFDAYCTMVNYNAERAREVDFLLPVFYARSDIFVKAGDTRFTDNPRKLDDPAYKLATVEGDYYSKLSHRDFTKAQKVDLPQLASTAELFDQIASGKADAVIMESSAGLAYMKANPGKIDRVKLDGPFLYTPSSVSIPGGQDRFRRMLDIALIEAFSNGTVDRILDKYAPDRGIVLRVAKPFDGGE